MTLRKRQYDCHGTRRNRHGLRHKRRRRRGRKRRRMRKNYRTKTAVALFSNLGRTPSLKYARRFYLRCRRNKGKKRLARSKNMTASKAGITLALGRARRGRRLGSHFTRRRCGLNNRTSRNACETTRNRLSRRRRSKGPKKPKGGKKGLRRRKKKRK